jgi:hypothetical protein
MFNAYSIDREKRHPYKFLCARLLVKRMSGGRQSGRALHDGGGSQLGDREQDF